jgi:hypothetical protein
VEVRWIVIIEKHFDDDPVEPGNFRHMPPFVLGLEISLRVSAFHREKTPLPAR